MIKHTIATTTAALVLLASGAAVAMPVLSADATQNFNGTVNLTGSTSKGADRADLSFPEVSMIYQGETQAMGSGGNTGVSEVPEPSIPALIGLGLIAMAVRRRQNRD